MHSVDMLRITFSLPHAEESRARLINHFCDPTRGDLEVYPQCFANNKYRNMVKATYDDTKGFTATYGFGFNGSKWEDNQHCFAEFNPNKVLNASNRALFVEDWMFILQNCHAFEIKRFDYAIDVPFPRERVRLQKDQRVYELKQYSESNKTEYLGVRNEHGRLKVYNKAKEDGLGVDLTRIEATCGGTAVLGEVLRAFGTIYLDVPDYQNTLLLDDDLTDTERVLVQLLRGLDNPLPYLKQIGRKTRKKVERLVLDKLQPLDLSLSAMYSLIVTDVRAYVNPTRFMDMLMSEDPTLTASPSEGKR